MGNIFGDAWNGVTEGASEAAGWVGEKASAAGGAVHDIYSSATGGQTNAQQAVQEKIQGAKKDAHQDLARLRKERSGLDVGESDPASIKQHDNWDNWNRDQLANKLKPSLKHGQITSAAEDWKNLGKEINEIFADLDKQTRQAAGDGMRGEAAEAGMNAAKPLQDWGTKFGEAVRGTGFKMEEAGIAAERTHSSIQEAPEPSNARAVIDGGMNVIAPGSGVVDGGNQMREREEGERQARQIVKNVYSPGYDKVDGSTPSLPKPVDPLNPSKSGDGNANGDGMPAGQTPGGGGSTTATPASMSASTAGDPGSSSVPGGTANPGTGSPASPGNTPSSPASNSSASAIPPGAGTPGGPGSGTPGTTSPGGPGGGGGAAFGAMPGGGAPGGAPGGGQPGGQGGARGGPGAGGRAGVGGSGGGQGGTAAAQGGGQNGGGRGGMGGGGQRGGGQQEDEEHERPSWLEENDDVWFNDMPKTAPPVLGG